MRILITGTTYYPGLNGQAIFTVNLAEGLARRGHEVTALFPELQSFSRLRNGVRMEAVGSFNLGFIHTESFVPLRFGRVRQVFESFRPELVHIHDHYPLSVAVVKEARRRGIPVLGTNHYSPASLEPYIPGASWLKPILDYILWEWMLRLYRRLDFVTAPSPAAVAVLEARSLKAPAASISCGTDLSRFRPDASVDRTACRQEYGLDPQAKLFLYVGRVDQEKRIDVLLRARQLLQRDDIQLGIAGQGAALAQLQHLSQDFNLGDRARFIGPVRNEDLNRLLNSADVFAMAGEAESLSIASLEAMASGLPVLLADAFALPQLVSPGLNGYLFKSGDPQDAARCMILLADRADQWKEMGRASMEKVKPHSLEVTLDRYAALYVQMLEDAPTSHVTAKSNLKNRGPEIAHRNGRP
jgi:1,2-diacylglycerol 3-alpha-glucosyltransferase